MQEEIKYSLHWVTERETICLDCGYIITGNSKANKIISYKKDNLRCLECYSKNIIESERYIEPRIDDKLLVIN